MTKALIILHAAPDAPDNRSYTAIRLAGAMMADNKDVCLFLVENGVRLADSKLAEDNPSRSLFHELLDVGMDVQVCGGTLRRLGWEESYPLPGVKKSSMKGLSTLISEADEVITF